jgi:outer membrane protein assembly factor BamD
MHKKSILITLGFIVPLVFGLTGCGYIDKFFSKEEDSNASELMAEGEEKLSKGYFGAASEAFQMVKDRYPYSKYAITAELKMADALYQSESYDDAFFAYDEFERLHPKNQQIPYVIYQKGMSHFQQMTTSDRDQSYTMKAKEEFERLINRFPRDNYANLARKNLRKCLIYLAEYELYVGHFYFKMGEYKAALERYSYIIKNYPDMGQYHEALEYMSKCKLKIAQSENDEEDKENSDVSFWKKINPFD